jgi:hypothetical protein
MQHHALMKSLAAESKCQTNNACDKSIEKDALESPDSLFPHQPLNAACMPSVKLGGACPAVEIVA